jgi:hypothetical protein|tara:strand:+ start:388 stop:519 length:132 start_codon:yes stop_codon:yes gene_type:complete
MPITISPKGKVKKHPYTKAGKAAAKKAAAKPGAKRVNRKVKGY